MILPEDILFKLLVIDGVLALAVLLIYTLFAPWWSTKTGLGVFALYWSVGLVIFHFGAEAIFGQANDWVEVLLAALLGLVFIWNGVLIIYKQVIMRKDLRLNGGDQIIVITRHTTPEGLTTVKVGLSDNLTSKDAQGILESLVRTGGKHSKEA